MKKIKKLLLVLLIIPCIFIFSACGAGQVVSVRKTFVTNDYTIYTLTYSDGSTSTIKVENQDEEQSSQVTLSQLYEYALANGFEGDELQFISTYFQSSEFSDENTLRNVNKALLSSVCVVCEIKTTQRGVKTTGINNGTGIIINLDKESGDAYIVTNYHVVYYQGSGISSNIKCFLYGSPVLYEYPLTEDKSDYLRNDDGYPIINYGEKVIDCQYVGGSMTQDIAVLKVSGSESLKSSFAMQASISNSDNVSVGETVYAIGNAKAMGISVTKGVISVESEYVATTLSDNTTQGTFRSIRTDAPVNEGNSGGGIFNTKGELVGIVNYKLVDTTIENMGFAIPSNIALRVASNIILNAQNHNQKAYKAVLGIIIQKSNFTASYDETSGLITLSEDITIKEISSSSAFAGTSLAVGDKVNSVTIGGKTYPISKDFQMVDLLWLVRPGEVVTLKVDGKADISAIIPTSSFTEVE